MPNRFSNPEEVKALRRNLGLTQQALGAEVFDLDARTAGKTISKIERGVIEPSAAVRRHLERIAKQKDA